MSPGPLREKISTDEGGCSQHPPFFFGDGLHRCYAVLAPPGQAAYWGAIAPVSRSFQVLSPWNPRQNCRKPTRASRS